MTPTPLLGLSSTHNGPQATLACSHSLSKTINPFHLYEIAVCGPSGTLFVLYDVGSGGVQREGESPNAPNKKLQNRANFA